MGGWGVGWVGGWLGGGGWVGQQFKFIKRKK